VFVDTDFLLALLKDSDWLKASAQRVLDEHGAVLRTPESTFLELLVILERFDLDLASLVAEVNDIAPLEDASVAALAVRNMRDHGLTPFDAYLAAKAMRWKEPLVSSDAAFDEVGVVRVPLGPGR